MKKANIFLMLILLTTLPIISAIRLRSAVKLDQYPQAHSNPLGLLTTLTKNNDTIILFYSNECGPCQTTNPIFDELAELFPSITFIKIEFDSFDEVIYEYKINRIPTILFIHRGKIIKRHIGSLTKETGIKIIKKIY